MTQRRWLARAAFALMFAAAGFMIGSPQVRRTGLRGRRGTLGILSATARWITR